MSRPWPVLGAAAVALAIAAAPALGAQPGFTARVTNPYYPLLPDMRWEYRGVKDGKPLRDVVRVTRRIERIRGVPCVVVLDRAYVDGRLRESTIDWFAHLARDRARPRRPRLGRRRRSARERVLARARRPLTAVVARARGSALARRRRTAAVPGLGSQRDRACMRA